MVLELIEEFSKPTSGLTEFLVPQGATSFGAAWVSCYCSAYSTAIISVSVGNHHINKPGWPFVEQERPLLAVCH